MSKEKILKPVKKIHGGVKLPHLKQTAEIETVLLPTPDKVYIPLSMHIGAPCVPVVQKGDIVFVGTLIAESSSRVSAPIHSSVSGIVVDIKDYSINGIPTKCIIIESDKQQTIEPNLTTFEVTSPNQLATAAKNCGLVGLGGAGFPSHVKLSPGENSTIDTLIINAAECEPYLTADYRECMENPNDIIEAVYLIKEKLNIDKVIICVEANKPKAIELLYKVATDKRDADDKVKLMELPCSYPQGAEKVIIYSATGREVPTGKLPSDVGCIVMNITSVATLYRFITRGTPLTHKRVTIEGDLVKDPKNLMIPIGTPISDIMSFMEIEPNDNMRIVLGGPMMGNPVVSDDTIIDKRTNGLLFLSNNLAYTQTACIRCGRCHDACSMSLYPAMVEMAYKSQNEEKYNELNVMNCMECGSCSYVCPAKRPLTQVMKNAKAALRRKK